MRLSRWAHACVRLEHDGVALVIDPGEWSEPEALQDATAVLITHEHADHVDVDVLAAAQTGNPSLVVHTNASLVAQLADKGITAQPASPGETVSVGGFDVDVVGGDHAKIYGGQPDCANVGFIVTAGDEGAVYHPGDSLFVPPQPVQTLLVPAGGSWLKVGEVIDFMRAVSPGRAFPIHDAMFNEIGRRAVDGWLGDKDDTGGIDYSRLAPGESVDL